MLLDVCKVVLLWKLDARSSLERPRAQVMQKVPKMIQNKHPGGASGSTLGPENVANMYKRCYFASVFLVSISEGLLGHIFSETASE